MKPKKFLFPSIDGLSSDIAWRVALEGHNVKFHIQNETQKDIGSGFFEKVDDWESHVNWADVIVFDDVLGQGKIAQELRKEGKLVVGGSPYTDRLEDDRSFGQEELKRAGVSIIPYRDFSSFGAAVKYVEKHHARYVIKPSGEQVLKSLLFVGEEEDGQDVIRILDAYRKVWNNKIKVFQLQRRVTGVEVAVGAFFNGHEFVYPINVNFEHKKLFPGNIGPSTGEMGTTSFFSMPNRIFNATLKKMELKLRKQEYVGYIDVNCIVNGTGIFPLEFTCRFGYPTIFIQQEGITMPVGEFFHALASGKKFEIKTRRGFQVGVRIVIPPFPFRDPETFKAYSKGAAILFRRPAEDGVPDGVHIEDVKIVNGQWVVAGDSGVPLTVVGTGSTMKQAQLQAYNRVNNIMIPNMYYRKDIGDRWFEDSDRLHVWGYLRDL